MKGLRAFNTKQRHFYAVNTFEFGEDMGISYDSEIGEVDIFMKRKDAQEFSDSMNDAFRKEVGQPLRAKVVKVSISKATGNP